MKPILRIFPILLAGLFTMPVLAQQAGQDSTGLPGDNFSLHGALQLFKKAGSPEEFEKLLNTEDNSVNNLDLDGNGEIDYIRVIDKSDKDVHAFVLQVPVSGSESQDIAVIELEKTGAETAVIQIIGDEDIFGEEVIVEPGDESGTGFLPADNYFGSTESGPAVNTEVDARGIVVNVWIWPSVRFIYGPVYRPWASPWRWRHYPGWWRPWRPHPFHVFHPRRLHYHRPFVVVHTHRVMRAHVVYKPFRTTSVTVRTRHSAAVNNYRVTRTRTTVTGPRGNSGTRTTTTVKRNGKVKASRTTVKKRRG
jgi:hypothetical protein